MYIPSFFKSDNSEDIKNFIHHNGFAILINEVNARPWGTHLPLVLSTNTEGNDILFGHISKANNQWKAFDSEKEVMAIFNGPHAYISSSWYNHENVPTWNYLAVHVYGKLRLVEGDELKNQLSKLVDKYEHGLPNPIKIEKMNQELIAKEIKGIVGFEILITEIHAANKMSQNRDAKNKELIVEGLNKKGDEASMQIASIISETPIIKL